MRLLVDCIPYDQGKSGISVYMRQVVRKLIDQGHTVTLLKEASCTEYFGDCEAITLPIWTDNPLVSMLWHLFVIPLQLLLWRKRFDRVIVLAGNRRLFCACPIPVTVVVHDLSQYHIDAKYDAFRTAYTRYVLPFFLRHLKADVVAISQSTRNDLINYWRIHADQIRIVYNGVNHATLPVDTNHGTGNEVLYVSRLEHPGKNHLRLIQAWEKLPLEILAKYKLVLVGADWPGSDCIRAAIACSPARDTIILKGFIETSELHALYSSCRLLVFPSLFEGFGLGLAEAMACGTICACSKTSSLGEIAQDAAITFEPTDTLAITNAITQGLTDEKLRATLRPKALERAKQFDWSKTAKSLIPDYAYSPTVTIFDVPIMRVTMAQTLEQIDQAILEQTPKMGAFVNADCLNQIYTNPAYQLILQKRASFIWGDGSGVAWAANHYNQPLPANINGTDLLPLLCERGYKLFLFGAMPGVADEAKAKLQSAHPNARIVGTHHGYYAPEECDSIIAQINDAKPDILLVAMGVPAQEMWIATHLGKLNVPLSIGVGGLFDFASERIPRAPLWMRNHGIEWMYRLYQEPRRLFKRYVIGNPLLVWRIFS